MRKKYIVIDPSQCKGCRYCVESCPNHCIEIGAEINDHGYRFAVFDSDQCTACGICFYVCPEPGAITVFKDSSK